jgi:VWFA-related protein
MSFDSAGRLRKALPKLFAQEQGGDSQYALVALGRDLRIVRSVTRKPEEILAAAESDSLMRALRESSGGNFAGQESQLRTMIDKYCRQCECIDTSAPTGRPTMLDSASACEVLFGNIEKWVATAARERSAAYRDFLVRLADIIRLTGQQPGKRIMIMASDGLDLWPGRDLYTLVAIYTNRPTFPLSNPTVRLEHELDAVARAATTSDVVVYTIDTRGIPPPAMGMFNAEYQGGRFARRDAGRAVHEMVTNVSLNENATQDTMAHLADVTGGVFFRGNNDLAKGMRQAFADEREYYVLAYAPSNRAQDRDFRKIRIELKDKKLKIRAKAGYWAAESPKNP